MRTTSRYLTREVLAHAGLGLLLFTFVIFMREAGRLLELAVRNSSFSVLTAFLYALPSTLVFTLPMAVLVGLLIALGRFGGDNELTAWRAAGVSGWQLARPLGALALAGLAVCAVFSLWIAPAGARALLRLEGGLVNSEIAFAVQPRVFLENIPHAVIYVSDVTAGGRDWENVFVADTSNPSWPRITMARHGQLLAVGPERMQLHLEQGASYDTPAGKPETLLASSFVTTDIPMSLPPPRAGKTVLEALPTGQLWQRARYSADWLTARIELYRRFALAFACLALALLGIPLGLRAGGGKATGFVLTLILVFAYYVVFILGIAMARQGRLPPALGVWAADLICGGLGLWLMFGTERIPDTRSRGRDPLARARDLAARWLRGGPSPPRRVRRGWLPALIDGYVVREFVGYVGLLLAALLVLILAFTFFELLGDMIRTRAGLAVMLRYLFFLSPQMLYILAPVAILVGVLVTFGLMSKSNEITAMKACGISIYRLLAPVAVVALIFAALQFGLDQSFLPAFNRRQDALRAVIKGRPAQTFERPERKWIFGQHNDIFYFQYFDPVHNEFGNVSVFDFDPQTFRLTHHIHARYAHWDSQLRAWIFAAGWERDLDGIAVRRYQPFQVASFAPITETPEYFKTDARESTQMSYEELSRYVGDLKRGGYDVSRLTVALDKKIAYPLITLIMAMLAFPFALSVGRRGTVTGIALAIGVAILYWVSAGFLEALGNLDQIPAAMAAWFPDLLFLVAGLYLLLRVPT